MLCDVEPATLHPLSKGERVEEGGGAPAPAVGASPAPSSLDIYGGSGTRSQPQRLWSGKQLHAWQLLKSLFKFWNAHGYQLRWVMLSTAEGGDARLLAYHHKRLRQSVERHLGFEGLEFVQVATDEGNGVLHVVWAWRGSRSFYVDQHWLSDEWERIHGAIVVWIAAIGNGKKDAHRTSRYMVTQYCVEQNGFKRLSWSWWRLPVAMSRGWETLKRLASESYQDDRFRWHRHYLYSIAEAVVAWEHLLESGGASLGNMVLEFHGRDLVEVS